MPNRQFSDEPLGPDENRWVREQMYRQEASRKQWQAWMTIPPAILAIVGLATAIWGYVSNFFSR